MSMMLTLSVEMAADEEQFDKLDALLTTFAEEHECQILHTGYQKGMRDYHLQVANEFDDDTINELTTLLDPFGQVEINWFKEVYRAVPAKNGMVDIVAPKHEVEVQIREDGEVLWVNVDGQCRLRICQIPPTVLTVAYPPKARLVHGSR